MKRNKVIFILLVISAVLYFITLGMGVKLNKDDTPTSAQIKDSWVKSMDGLLSHFGPSLNLKGLYCEQQPVARIFTLTSEREKCEISIPRDPDEKYRKGNLRVFDTGVKVYLRSDAEERAPDCLNDDQIDSGLNIEYFPAGKPDEKSQVTPICWLAVESEDPIRMIRVMVMQTGGVLRLICTICKDRTQFSLRLKMQ